MTPVKPGYKTTEFYLSLLAMLIGALYTSGLIGANTTLDHALGFASMILSSLGYTVSRGIAKGGAAANDNVQAAPAMRQAGFASVVVMLFIAIAGVTLLVSGCGPKVVAAERQFLTCAESAVAHDLTPTVEAILAQGASNWKAQITAFGVAFGTDAINCAVLAARTMFSTKVGVGAAGSALERANEWMKEHGGS